MPKRKYEHLVKPLSVGAVNIESAQKRLSPKGEPPKEKGNADKLVWLNGKQHLEGLNLNCTWGFYSGLGEGHPGLDPHIHPYPECLVFVGLDPTNIGYLGAEIEILLGEELETYTFDKPTVVVVPAGFPHCPIRAKKVTNPKGFSFYLIALGTETTTTWMGTGASVEDIAKMQKSSASRGMRVSVSEKRIDPSKPRSTGRKYAHLVRPLKSETMIGAGGILPETVARREEKVRQELKMGPGNADQLVWMYGKDLEGMDLNFAWGYCSKPGIWHRGGGAHVHPIDEVLFFVGLDPTNIDYLGAELEIDMGKEHERYVFNKPTVVICPGGLPHLPLVTRWVDQPYAFYRVGLGAEHESQFID
jgi:hypothetical protein